MIRFFTRYLHHVRRQSQSIKEVHAVLFATVGTILFVFLYIYIAGVSDDTDKEGKPVLSSNFASPFKLFFEQVKSATAQLGSGSSFKVINDGGDGKVLEE